MNAFVSIVMFGWIPAVVGIFLLLPARRAVIVAFLAAWLFLPMVEFKISNLPDYTKMSATCVGVLLGVLFFDTGRLASFRLHWIDIPILVWCLCPIASSLSNGLGLYDGLSTALLETVRWGVPYLIGRGYFSDMVSVRELALGIFIGGLVYMPLCLFEVRMSPMLHSMIYGFHQPGRFGESYRWGGWRPQVFMEHGLMVGMWMAATTLVGLWLWITGSLKRLWGIPMSVLVPAMLVTTVQVKSTGAIVLMAFGIAATLATKLLGKPTVIACLVLVPPFYMIARAGGYWSGEELVAIALEHAGPERASSMDTRLHEENNLAAHALKQPVFGWGGWGRSLVDTPDALWVLVMGKYGLVGLVALTSAFLLPVAVLLRRFPYQWAAPAGASVAALSTITVIYMLDNLSNAMLNPVFTLAVGGLCGLASRRPSDAREARC